MHHTPSVIIILTRDEAEAVLSALDESFLQDADHPDLCRARDRVESAIDDYTYCLKWHRDPTHPSRAGRCRNCREVAATSDAGRSAVRA